MQLNYFLKKENMAVGMGTKIKDVSEENFSKLKNKKQKTKPGYGNTKTLPLSRQNR